ncbi:MAG: cadmium-translocating P-type ATPase [Oscillospiraceae bacterium]|nr:cadmium-translocating P-type ATPase [Oscillospiraceae bacterium]
MNKKQKLTLCRIIVAAVLLVALIVLDHLGTLAPLHRLARLGLYLIPYLLIGWDILWEAVENVFHGQLFDENFLMAVASVAAFCIGEYPEAAAVMLLYQIGELFQDCAVDKSRKSIADMMDIAPEFANLETPEGLEAVDPEDVAVGSVLVIKPGERIPLDAVVLEGESLIDTAALTGESVPRRAAPGDEIISGCINGSGTLRVRTLKSYSDSTVTRILDLVENASSRKAKSENFITKFAKWYTPLVTIAAVLLAVLPPLLLDKDWGEWIRRACIFLVVSCPCALVISVPLGFFGGIGAASRKGVLVKGSNYLEALARLSTLVFDKTGTLTKGEFKVSAILPARGSAEELLELAAHAEAFSNHPIAASIREAWGRPIGSGRIGSVEEEAGQGVVAQVDGKEVLMGSLRLLRDHGVVCQETTREGTVVYGAANGQYLGLIVISDALKEGAEEAVAAIRAAGVKKTVMLTGDRQQSAEAMGKALGLDEIHAELLPQDKVALVEKLLREEKGKETLAFVGDGLNDAPVLGRADVGVAMGSLGSDAAIEAADLVIMDDDLRKLPAAVRIARKTLRIVRQNITFALVVKFAILILGALGIANMWLAVFGDVGVSIIAILNSMRTLKE